ncbi:MAG: bifunctional diaminohydroxyphosphoribosylaminopyrimidine deaminase/5-amino-6-(5-phosphoribosylamino)uracil reductase RibD [Elusimicrobia bacterium]|nr:bifunctional diaminohydroxyphosphoribosylaminopyrimidine deaminase/5-amino-6-(5-phosphoribosylamino)uracil reductase RibD [Elusimicrobiota bacterium]
MARALALARRGGAAVRPNPKVGCVLVKGGKVVSEGWHRTCGGPHAEAAALSRAGSQAKGATAYVTLEPCVAHQGKKTPPCAQALAKAGVARVVAASKDLNPSMRGAGFLALRHAGIEVEVGLLAREALTLNKEFFRHMGAKRPYVILKTALSLDGRAYCTGGASRWITGPRARREAHLLRARCDAVLVGIKTVLADDPALTAHGAGRDPVKVVLDSRLRTPAKARILEGKAPTLIFTRSRKILRSPPRLAEVIRVPAKGGGLDLGAVLRELLARGIRTVLVEGGPTVHASFLSAGAVDEARVFLAPKLISGASDPGQAPRLKAVRLKKIGPDFLFYGSVDPPR